MTTIFFTCFINKKNIKFSMITRKVQNFGYTKMVSLPKYWLQQNDISDNDVIQMKILSDGNLLILKKGRGSR